ncbi:MAG: hypothetical protein EOS05_10285 [Mesorhizobium sp.]|nr:MAG: hypothetical protein EOS05_10285 [Mesorhizobium sp.]
MASFWKSPVEIYKAILARAQSLEDGTPAKDAIAGYLEQIKFENAAWDLSERGRRVFHPEGETDEVRAHYAGERVAYDANVAAIVARIADTQAAVHRLMISQAVDGIWFAAGHRSQEKGQEIIPAHYWPFLALDVENGTAKGEHGEYRALRCAFLRDVPADHQIRGRVLEANRLTTDAPPAARTGRTATRSQMPRARGRKPLVLERVKSAMLTVDPGDLATMKEEAMAATFHASRDICRRARRELSEIE